MKNGPELFDLIIDNLTDDLATLRSRALVSSSFYSRTRARVFSHLRVHYSLDKEHAAELHQLLEDSPSFAARGESLHVCGNYAGIIGADTDSAQISSLLGSLTRLEITIKRGIRWTSIPVPLRNSIQGTLARTTFTCLELNYVYDLPFIVLIACLALRSVALRGVSFDKRDTSDSAIATSPPVRLAHVDLALGTSQLDLYLRWILLPALACMRW
jgi:hypothetical protein